MEESKQREELLNELADTSELSYARSTASENPQPGKAAFIVSLIIFGLLIVYAFVQSHLQELSAVSSNIVMGVLIAGCIYLVVRYFRQIRNAAMIARRGNTLLAKKAALEAFVPMLGSVNLAVYNFLNSEIVQKYIGTFRESGSMVKGWLTSVSPDKGLYIYYGGTAVLVILLNCIIVKNFKRALRIARILEA